MKLLNLELEADPPDVPAPRSGEQWVLVRLRGHPLGMLRLESRSYPGPELQRVAVEHLWWDIALERTRRRLRVIDERATLPAMTVAVCTRGGAARLQPCLEALHSLEYPREQLDLIVVDNAPRDDSTRQVLARFPSIRYVPEPRPGLDWARNRAVLESRGDIVAFTDDDVSVDSAWATAIARVFAEEPDAMAVTGLVVPDEIDREAQLLFEQYGGFGRGFRRRYFRANRRAGELAASRHGGIGAFGTGANMAFRRAIFTTIGLFDPALDVGTVTNGGGDLEMFFRVIRAGHLLVYAPEAIVRHRHRREYAQLRTQLANNGIGFYSYLVRSIRAYRDETFPLVRVGVWWFWTWNLRRLLVSFVRPSAFPRDLIFAELAGSLVGLRRYGKARADADRIAKHFGPQVPSKSGAGQ